MKLSRIAPFFAAAVLLAACDTPNEAFHPTSASVSGVYGASGNFGAFRLVTTDGEGTIDWLEAGASITLRLNADRTTSGELFIPGGDEDGNDYTADLTGTWSLNGNTVEFEHESDTFLRDMPFTVHRDRLEGDETFGETRVEVTLQRQ